LTDDFTINYLLDTVELNDKNQIGRQEFKMFFKGSEDDFIEIFNFSSKIIKLLR